MTQLKHGEIHVLFCLIFFRLFVVVEEIRYETVN